MASQREPTRAAPSRGPPPPGPVDGGLDPVAARVEIWLPDPRRRRVALAGAAFGLMGLGGLLPTLGGLSGGWVLGRVLPACVVVAAVTWGVVYVGALALLEWTGQRSTAHLSEPDFSVRVPFVEPLVGAAGLLAGVAWVLGSGLAAEGVGAALGAIAAMGLVLVGAGLGVSGLARPLAARFARERAYRQYVEGSEASRAKNNPRRARRLLERALEIAADTSERRADLEARHQQATLEEAERLREKGLDDQADALVARLVRPARRAAEGGGSPRRAGRASSGAALRRAAPRETPSPSRRRGAPPRGHPGGAAEAAPTDLVARATRPPARLPVHGLRLYRPGEGPPREPSARTVFDRAAALAARDRPREAVELLVEAGLPVRPELAEAAAERYIAQGMLRSAFLLYRARGDEQIVEFYKAAALEWARSPDPAPDRLALGELLLDALEVRGQSVTAARAACQAVLADDVEAAVRAAMATRARRILDELGEATPPEILEASGALEAAADAYREAGRVEDAGRCLERVADRLLAEGAGRDRLVPVLSRLFIATPRLSDERLSPLVEHVVETEATSAQAQRILAAWRARHPDDARVGRRLFELLVLAERPQEALAELERLAALPSSEPASLVEAFRRLARAFPADAGARQALARILVRAGRAREAAEQLELFLDRDLDALPRGQRSRLRTLLGSLREWGSLERELERLDGLLAVSLDETEDAVDAFDRYVVRGGRDPAAVAEVRAALEPRLVHPDGRPDHETHARLARFLLSAGLLTEAAPVLEVLRASEDHGEEALILLTRVEQAVGDPERGLRMLAGALEGRTPADAPHLFFEIARAYEAMGDADRARRVDAALERGHPGFAARYAAERPRVERADTAPLDAPTEIASGEDDDRNIDETALGLQQALRAVVGEARGEAGIGLAEALEPRYRLSRRLGSGGMGEVHLAEDVALAREVAVKVLRRTLATDLFISKFRDEARIVAQLSHPGIVGVYDVGQRGDWSYIVMEYVRGRNLAAVVVDDPPPSRGRLLRAVAQVADAMAYAHRRGVVHRDLKPANILVGEAGEVKVTDFGIARVLAGERGEETAFSAAGLQVGTLNFMAPEQLLHDHADERTDIYLLTTTLFYGLCRRYPFSGEAAQAQKTKREAPRLSSRLPEVSSELDALVATGLARRPEARPTSMEAFARALRATPEAAGEDPTEVLAPSP